MCKISAYYFSLLLLLCCTYTRVHAQDTIPITLKIKLGIEASGPVIHYFDKNILNTEGYIAIDLNEKRTATFAAGYLNYTYKQYNYTYLNKGSFIRLGMDFNILKADKSMGKYFAGIGLKYGLSRFTYQVPFIEKTNYWGTTSSSLPQKTKWGHFIEADPGVRAEIFKNFSMGWSVSVRMLLYTGTGSDLKPVYFPGYGDGTKKITTGMSYYLVWNIPYKKIRAIMKKEVQEENDDTDNPNTSGTTGNRQQGTGIRQ
jgi:hypothetical protein